MDAWGEWCGRAPAEVVKAARGEGGLMHAPDAAS